MKTQNRNPIEAAVLRCVDYAFAEHDQSTQMRSILVSIDNPCKWPLDLNALKSLDPDRKKDAFFLLTWCVSMRSEGSVRELVQNGDKVFKQMIEEEIQAVVRTATDKATWSTGYWKKNGKSAMEYRFGSKVAEDFDEILLMNRLQSENEH